MRIWKIVSLLVFLWCSTDALAQISAGPSSMPEQWQLTLDVIKNKAQTLLIKNNEIQAEYRQLKELVQDLKVNLKEKQDENDRISLFLNQRHGRTDQQIRTDQLQQAIKTKKQQQKDSRQQLENLNKKQVDLDRKIRLQKRNVLDIQQRQREQEQKKTAPDSLQAADGQLTDLRSQLEEEKKQEVILENQWSSLKSGGQSQNLNGDTIEAQNKQLEMHLQDLQARKKPTDGTLGQANQRRYDELKKRKDQLESDISAYEMRMDQLKDSSGLTTLPWPAVKKKLIHEMVQKDARNNQLREKIKILREDVDILRDQVAKLERRVNFVQGKDKTQ